MTILLMPDEILNCKGWLDREFSLLKPALVLPVGKLAISQFIPLAPLTEAAFSEELSERTFRYFWDTTDTERCLAPDRWPSNPFSSVAASASSPGSAPP